MFRQFLNSIIWRLYTLRGEAQLLDKWYEPYNRRARAKRDLASRRKTGWIA